MTDITNFKDWIIVAAHYWPWLVLACLLGVWVGFKARQQENSPRNMQG